MGFLLFALCALVAVVTVILWRGRQIGQLAREGVKVTGTVVRKFRTGSGRAGSRGRRIAFTYRGPDGVEYRRAASITLSQWTELEEGYPIALIVLPSKPGVSAPAWLVEAAREALQKAGKL
jgi:Protein of unknown function (DUF3592)